MDVAVTDDGRGFDAEATAFSSNRRGGLSMRETVAKLGGGVHFRSARKGTRVVVQIPLTGREVEPLTGGGLSEAPSRKPKIRVLIADDHAILRSGLKMLVNAQADMEVVGEAADGEQAVRAVHETKPDVALVDIAMPSTGGMVALQRIVRDCQRTRVLVLTMHDDPAYLRSALAAGASGYVLKKSVDAELLAAIRAVHRGGTFVDPSLALVLVRDVPVRTDAKAGSIKLLSDRELQVLGLVARGYSSRQIASRILVSVKSVETYRSRFADKLGLRKRSEVVRFAIQMGLLTPETLEADEGLPGR